MKYPLNFFLFKTFALLFFASSFTHGKEAFNVAPQLSSESLESIRGVSRQILAAKKSGSTDLSDVSQLNSFRAILDKLIAAELGSKSRRPNREKGQSIAHQLQSRERVAELRKAARADARALVNQSRNRNEINTSRVRNSTQNEASPDETAITEQRIQLFDRWATKLDSALADDSHKRLATLLSLRRQLSRNSQNSASDPSVLTPTPTLRAVSLSNTQAKQ
jgi:hypothetical protein